MASKFEMDITLSGTDADGEPTELALEIEYEVSSWGCPAQTYGPAESCHDAEPPEIDGLRVLTINGKIPDEATAKILAQRVYDERWDELFQDACEHAESRASDFDDDYREF